MPILKLKEIDRRDENEISRKVNFNAKKILI